jgi:hypothetical protein
MAVDILNQVLEFDRSGAISQSDIHLPELGSTNLAPRVV